VVGICWGRVTIRLWSGGSGRGEWGARGWGSKHGGEMRVERAGFEWEIGELRRSSTGRLLGKRGEGGGGDGGGSKSKPAAGGSIGRGEWVGWERRG